jgi:hypothetical protein
VLLVGSACSEAAACSADDEALSAPLMTLTASLLLAPLMTEIDNFLFLTENY